jgi:hypothetical protein
MRKPTLLADLAWRLASSTEDLATDALTTILGRSEAARQALNSLIQQWSGSPECSVARWKSQVVGADDSRTDMEGDDVSGVLRVILENKFWAGLTPNQPSTYLRRLSADHGVLAFVVPTVRLTAIEFELLDRASLSGFGTLEFRGAGASRVAMVSNAQTLVVTSWDVILTTIASALEGAQDHTALADIRQLQGLTEKADTESFLPFTATDITGPTPRVLLQCYQVIDEAWTVLARDSFVTYKGLSKGVGAGWYGPNFRLHGFGCSLLFSAQRWVKFGISPIWLRVTTGDWALPENLHIPLQAMLPDPTWLREEDGYWAGLWLPIRLTEGRDKNVVVAGVVSQVQRVASVLAAQPMLGSLTVPPVVAPS